jgi:hypothetical protein
MPRSRDRADGPRRFGAPPPPTLLGLGAACLLAALGLFADGSWPYGLILLGLSALLGAAFLETAESRPGATTAREALAAALRARSWGSAQLELARARSSALAEAQRVRAAEAVIETDRRQALLQLGEAVHSEDDAAEATARERLFELQQAEDALAGRVERRRAETEERIRRVRTARAQTLVVPPDTDLPEA